MRTGTLSMKAPPRIALLIETASSWGARLVEGIAGYANAHGGWLFYLEPHGKFDVQSMPANWKGEGIIARVTSPRLAEEIVASKLPAVNVSWSSLCLGLLPQCTVDEESTGRLAAEHLLDRGLREFGYCGSWRRPYHVDRLGPSFAARVAEKGYPCSTFTSSPDMAALSWHEQLLELGRWLSALPRPVGILTFDCLLGRQITEACRLRNLHVPDEVAVIGSEYDELTSSISSPPLSGIDLAPRRVGFEAAAMLDRLLRGEGNGEEQVLLPPEGVVVRRSTDLIALEDQEVAAALRFIRDHAHEAICVTEVVKHVAISRRALEQRFRSLVGRSPAEEIRRAHLERAKRLLRETSLPLPTVAGKSGFESAELLGRVFRREMHLTPSAYRRKFI